MGSQLTASQSLERVCLSSREIMAFNTSVPKLSGAATAEEIAQYKKTAIMWKKISALIGTPVCFGLLALAVQVELSHFKHPRPEFVHYEYLCVRKKKFPWYDGNRSLFHNGYVNALPDGFEKEWFVSGDDHH